MNSNEVRFSIIIIHRNNFERISSIVKSVIKYKQVNDEIIVIDNNSSDDSIKRLEKIYSVEEIKIIKNNCNAGYGFACNQGMHAARGQYFLLCNNDIELKSDTLEKFEMFLILDPHAGLIGPQMFSPTGQKMNSYSSKTPGLMSQLDIIGRPYRNRKIKKFNQVSVLRGACLAVNREMTDELGIYDEDFYFYHEETEWCIRINKSKKWKVMFAPEIQISHIGGASTSSLFPESRIEFFRSRLIFWSKVFPKHKVLVLYLWNIPKIVLDFLFYFLITIITLGMVKKFKNKFIDRAVQIFWLVSGKPNSWGLPNKCN